MATTPSHRRRLLTHSEMSRVRQNVFPAGVAALILLYFGFAVFEFQAVKDTFTLGDTLFNYTIRIGGIALAILAAASLSGRAVVLLADAFVSILVGAGLILGGLLMMAGGAMTTGYFLYLIFGGLFVSSGMRNLRDYRKISGDSGGASRDDVAREFLDSTPTRTTELSSASELPQQVPLRRLGPGASNEAKPVRIPKPGVKQLLDRRPTQVSETPAPVHQESPLPKDLSSVDPPEKKELPPPGGFLASFAKKPPE